MSRPLLVLAVALCAGSLAGSELPLRAAVILLLLAMALLLLARFERPLFALSAAALAVGAAASAVESAEYTRTPLYRLVQADPLADAPVLLRGRAAADARELDERSALLLDLETMHDGARAIAMTGRIRVEVAGVLREEVREGDRLAVWAQVRAVRGLGNPGSAPAEERARREGIHATAWCKSPLLVQVAPRTPPRTLAAVAALVRSWGRTQIRRFVLPGQEQALVRAMVLGDRTGLDPETAEAFRIAGTYHVLAISGAQVAMVVGVLLLLLRRLALSPWMQALLLSLAVAFYAELVGGDVPVARAALTAVVLIVGRALDLDADLANLLGLAAGLLVLWRPSAVGDVSFQLSFAATLAILLIAPPLPELPLRLDLALSGSIAAQVALTPLLLVQFHRLAPAALLLNLAAVPLSGAVLLLGLLLLAATPVASLAALLGDLSWLAAHALLRSGEIVRLAKWADVRVATPPGWAILLYVIGLCALVDSRRRRPAITLLAVGFIGMLWPHPPNGDGRLHLTVLDVGQGDGLLVRSPLGRTWEIDAGGAYGARGGAGEAVVAPALWDAGVTRIETLVMTHAHPDHVGGVPFLLQSFDVGAVWEGPAPIHDAGYQALDNSLRASGVPRLAVVAGLHASWDGVLVDVIGPRAPTRPPWTARNDDSIVLLLTYGEVTFLLAGDVEAAGEAALRLSGPATVLKVPHHGSRTSSGSAFLKVLLPRIAIVSNGYRNRFGHPHPEVVARYLASGALLYRTDYDGAVTVETDGRSLSVDTFRNTWE